jgi:prepilin-type N-terminal cleavage/methylation domain-containing protein
MKGLSNNRGFTLVEVLVVMAISTILLGVLIGIIVSGNKQYTRIKKEDETFSELQMVRKAITNELKSNNESVKLADKSDADEDYHTLLIGDHYYIAFNKKSKILTINSKEFNFKYNFKYIEDIYYNRYSTSNLLII